MVYLIEKIWTDSMENKSERALGYSPVGYVYSEKAAKKFCGKGRIYTDNDCWAIFTQMPEYTYKEINPISAEKSEPDQIDMMGEDDLRGELRKALDEIEKHGDVAIIFDEHNVAVSVVMRDKQGKTFEVVWHKSWPAEEKS